MIEKDLWNWSLNLLTKKILVLQRTTDLENVEDFQGNFAWRLPPTCTVKSEKNLLKSTKCSNRFYKVLEHISYGLDNEDNKELLI